MLIKNGLVYIDGMFQRTDVHVEGSCISEIARNLNETEYIDATGKYITPGLIEAHSHIGICEEIIGWAGDDINEESNPVTPQLHAVDGINPFDIAFKEALRGGVTTMCTGPGSANVVGGTFTIIQNKGTVIDEMIIVKDAAMKCAFGENPKWYGKNGKAPYTRMAVAALLRQCLEDARFYAMKKEDAIKKGEAFKIESGMENMCKVLQGEIPLKCHVHRADDIATAIRIGKEYNIKITLDHCTEGHLIPEYIAASGYPAIVGPSFGCKSKIELANKSFDTVKRLVDKGVLVAITTDHNVNPQEALILFAAMAHRAGITISQAMDCITINPARILKIDDRKGSICVGKDADIVIWSGHPLEINSRVERVIIGGDTMYTL